MLKLLSLFECGRGTVAALTAISIPVLLIVAGGALDFSVFLNQRSSLQAQVDAAALSAGHVFLSQPMKSEAELSASIKDQVSKFLAAANADPAKNVEVVVNAKERLVTVTAHLSVNTSFLTLAGIKTFDATVEAGASVEIEQQPVCILALKAVSGTGIKFTGGGEMKAKDCVIWSNASGFQSIDFGGNGKVSASRICARGRAGTADSFSVKPQPESGCAFIEDPLKSWEEPPVGACEHQNLGWITGTTAQLKEGVYCGGLRVDAKNIFMSGTYIVKDGPLILRGSSKIVGKDVGIFLTGTDTKLDIDGKSNVNLVAAKEGPMAGIAIASARNGTAEQSSIAGRSDLKIGGIIYLPTHDINYWGESDTRAASPVTTIIGNTIEIGGDAYLEVKNDKSKAKYAPIVTTGSGAVKLVK